MVELFAVECNLFNNRFHFSVRLYSDSAQITSTRGESKEVDVLTTF